MKVISNINQTKANPDVVSMLESLLEKAKAGELQMIAGTGLVEKDRSRVYINFYTKPNGPFEVLGALEDLKLNFWKDCLEDEEEDEDA